MRVLKDGAVHLAKPYHKLMNMICITKTIPNQKKVARILPLHKKGLKTTLTITITIESVCGNKNLWKVYPKTHCIPGGGGKFVHGKATRLQKREEYNFSSLSTAARDIKSHGRQQLCGRCESGFQLSFWCSQHWTATNTHHKNGPTTRRRQTTTGMAGGQNHVRGSGGVVLGILWCAAYADDSYHIAISESKQDAVRTFQDRIIESENWLASLGLKVNLEKPS